MTDPVLDTVAAAIAARQAAEHTEHQAIADALNAPRTWRQLAEHLGQNPGNLHRKYAKHLTLTGRVYEVAKPA